MAEHSDASFCSMVSGADVAEIAVLDAERAALDPARVERVKYLRRIFLVLQRLVPSPAEVGPVGNRRQFLAQSASRCMGLLIPTRQSLRGLSEMSRLRKAQGEAGDRRLAGLDGIPDRIGASL